MQQYADSWLELDALGSCVPHYRPTHEFPGQYLDDSHRAISELPLENEMLIEMRTRRWFGRVIPGWLLRADALKLYEMAYFARDGVLELGSYHGLSTAIMASAVRNAGHACRIHSVDLAPQYTDATKRTLRRLGVGDVVDLQCGDGVAITRTFAASGPRFDFVFVDHSHEYEPVRDVCKELGRVITPGGFCLFHDFNDPRNGDPKETGYGVYQGVADGLPHADFEFYGLHGCAALYRRRAG